MPPFYASIFPVVKTRGKLKATLAKSAEYNRGYRMIAMSPCKLRHQPVEPLAALKYASKFAHILQLIWLQSISIELENKWRSIPEESAQYALSEFRFITPLIF